LSRLRAARSRLGGEQGSALADSHGQSSVIDGGISPFGAIFVTGNDYRHGERATTGSDKYRSCSHPMHRHTKSSGQLSSQVQHVTLQACVPSVSSLSWPSCAVLAQEAKMYRHHTLGLSTCPNLNSWALCSASSRCRPIQVSPAGPRCARPCHDGTFPFVRALRLSGRLPQTEQRLA
jgi:hypothetical protein